MRTASGESNHVSAIRRETKGETTKSEVEKGGAKDKEIMKKVVKGKEASR